MSTIFTVAKMPDQIKHAAGKRSGKTRHLIDLAESVILLDLVGDMPLVMPPTHRFIRIYQGAPMDPEFFQCCVKILLIHIQFMTQGRQRSFVFCKPLMDSFQDLLRGITFFVEELVNTSVAIRVAEE